MNTPRRIFTSLILVFACSATLAQTRDATSKAMELVRVAKFDQGAIIGAQMAVKRAAEEGKTSPQESECFSQKSSAPLIGPIARYLESQLSFEELDAALRFYSSEVGKKYTQHGMVSFYKQKGIDTKEVPPSFSQSEMSVIEAFSKTGAGDKLIFKQILQKFTRDSNLMQLINQIRSECRVG